MDSESSTPTILKRMASYAMRLQTGDYVHEFEAEEMRRFVATIHTKLFGWDENFANRCGFTRDHVDNI